MCTGSTQAPNAICCGWGLSTWLDRRFLCTMCTCGIGPWLDAVPMRFTGEGSRQADAGQMWHSMTRSCIGLSVLWMGPDERSLKEQTSPEQHLCTARSFNRTIEPPPPPFPRIGGQFDNWWYVCDSGHWPPSPAVCSLWSTESSTPLTRAIQTTRLKLGRSFHIATACRRRVSQRILRTHQDPAGL